MMNQYTLILIVFISINLAAQDKSIILSGKITSDSLAIENVHIINKSTKKGTISDQKGMFSIAAKINDTLLFSGIQFYHFELKITKQILNEKQLNISLLQRINTLNEVVLRAHDLSGNLIIDSKKFNDTLQKANPLALNFDGIYKVPSNIVASKLNSNNLPDVTDPMAPIGGDLLGLTLFLFKPLIKEVSKIGKTKRDQKKKERHYQKQAVKAPETIRNEFGDSFFINKLHISPDQIDSFILHCKTKGIIDLFLHHKKLEMIDVFLTESKIYQNN